MDQSARSHAQIIPSIYKTNKKKIVKHPTISKSSLSLRTNTLKVGSSLSLLLTSIKLKLLSVVDGWNPANRVPSAGNLSIKLINLLKGKTLGLVNASVNKHTTDEAESTPNEEHLRLEVGVSRSAVHHVRSSVGNSPVEQPVGGGGDGETLGASLEGEQFTGDDPGDGAPGASEEEDVDAHEGDEDLVRDVGVDGCADDGDDELRDAHSDSTEHEQRTTTPFLDHVETGEGGDDVDDACDQGDDEGVLDAGVLEEGCAVVDCGFC